MFFSQAGAAAVITVDRGAITDITSKVVTENKMDEKIHVINSQVDDLSLPNGFVKVDTIVSDWFGEMLLHRSSLLSVIKARDKFLKPGGKIFPDTASLYIVGIDDCQYFDQTLLSFWTDVYGINMAAMADTERMEPHYINLDEKNVMTNNRLLWEIDMNTIKKEEIEFNVPFELDIVKTGYIRGFAIYYSATFSEGLERITFSTLQSLEKTVVYLDKFLICRVGDQLKGTIHMKPEEGKLKMRVNVDFKVEKLDKVNFVIQIVVVQGSVMEVIQSKNFVMI